MLHIMENKKNNPKLKISRTTLDWLIEFFALSFLIILIGLPLFFSSELPERIPVHFNFAGEPDGYGTRVTLWILPVTGTLMYMGMTILESFPHIYNYLVDITPENVVKQYRLGTRLIRILKTIILIIFSFISYQTIKTALGSTAGLGKAFLPVFLLITFGTIIIYVVISLNNRHMN
jgi:uncharacterized membrane protein